MNNYNDDFVFVWLRDQMPNGTYCEESAIQHVQKLVDAFYIVENADDCVDYISSLPEEVIFLRLGHGWSHLVPFLHGINQIHCIYLSEPAAHEYEQRIRGTFPSIAELCHQLSKDIRLFENRLTHLTWCEDRASRLETSTGDLQREGRKLAYSQLLIKLLIEMPVSTDDTSRQVLDEARRYYEHNPSELKKIDEFERDYKADDALSWYTRDSFVYRMINKALRTQNLPIIYKFRSLIGDIHRQLKKLQDRQGSLSSGTFSIVNFA